MVYTVCQAYLLSNFDKDGMVYVVFCVFSEFYEPGAMLMEDEGIVIAGLLVGLNDCMIYYYVIFSVSFMSRVPC